MNKARFTSLIVFSILALAVLVAFLVSSSQANAGFQASILPNSGNSSLGFTGPMALNCYSAAFQAASDCDRLASSQTLIQPFGQAVSRLTSQTCFSAAYHSATDCDRLASLDTQSTISRPVSDGPQPQDCFSAEYHAASDCDRLAPAKK